MKALISVKKRVYRKGRSVTRLFTRIYCKELIGQIFPVFEYRNFGMWEGVDEGSSTWHNDWEDGKNMNTNVLV